MVKGDSIGCIRNGIHRIRTTDCIPVAQPYRRVVPTQLEGVKSQIDEWLREGILSRSESEYASPLVVVKKKDGDIRLCVDYRDLNKKTVKDAYPIPRIDDSLESLGGQHSSLFLI